MLIGFTATVKVGTKKAPSGAFFIFYGRCGSTCVAIPLHKQTSGVRGTRGIPFPKGAKIMEKVILTAELLAAIVCLPRQRQLDLLKEVVTGHEKLVWDAEKRELVRYPVK